MEEVSKESQKEFKDIFKISASYGILQVFQIFINLVKAKLIALFLGPIGVGLSSLFQSGTGLIATIVNNGLTTTAVKELSGLDSIEKRNEEGIRISAFKRLLWVTGILGTIVTLLFSRSLSRLSFDSDNYVYSFQILSCSILINQVSLGYGVLLRSRRKTNKIIKSTLISSGLSLVITMPILAVFKTSAIAPSIVITSLINLLVLKFFNKDELYNRVNISFVEAFKVGKVMMKSGFFVSLSSLFTSLVTYIFITFLSRSSSSSIVGLYSAGFAILNTYVGLVFNAMAQDFYPRLSEKVNNKDEINSLIGSQIEISILLVSPLLVGIVLYNEFVIRLLFTRDFLPMSTMIVFASLGIYFKVFAWVAGFLIMASGRFKIYLYLEIMVLAVSLILNFVFFINYGLSGLGISSSITVLLAALVYVRVARIKLNIQTIVLVTFNFLFISGSILLILLTADVRSNFFVLLKILYFAFGLVLNFRILNRKLGNSLLNFLKKVVV